MCQIKVVQKLKTYILCSITPFSQIFTVYEVKGLPQHAEVVQEVPGRLSPLIFLTFGTTKAVGRQPYPPAAFTTGEIPGTPF